MIEINSNIQLLDNEVEYNYIRASGPGGQNVNKVSTAVQLRFHLVVSPSLNQEVKNRLFLLARKIINDEGVLIIEAKRFRTQEKNKSDAVNRLKLLIEKAVLIPKKRIDTRPSLSSVTKRLHAKKKRAIIKQFRSHEIDD